MDFIETPDKMIRKDIIRSVKKYERDKYEGGIYYGIEIIEENNIRHSWEKLDRGGLCSNGQEKWRDDLYDNIKQQLQTDLVEKVGD